MRLLITAMAAFSLFGAALPARADDYPPRRAGLWEMTMNFGHRQATPMVSKFCVDAETDAAMYKAGLETPGITCSRRDVVRSGPTLTIDSVCKMDERTVTSHMTTLFNGDTAYHSERTSHIEPPFAPGRPDSTSSQDAKWIGPCPAGMKPGDMVMPNGIRMNLIEAMKGVK